jgi:hypothetical protein
MPAIEHQNYQGYAIVAMATPAGGGKYHSIFSVEKADQPDLIGLMNQPAIDHREKITDNPTFSTEEEAVEAARGRAQGWIDKQAK